MLDFLKNIFTPKKGTSPAGKVDKNDVVDVTKVALLVGIAAALQSAISSLAGVDMGNWGPLVTLGLTAALDFVNKFVKKNA